MVPLFEWSLFRSTLQSITKVIRDGPGKKMMSRRLISNLVSSFFGNPLTEFAKLIFHNYAKGVRKSTFLGLEVHQSTSTASSAWNHVDGLKSGAVDSLKTTEVHIENALFLKNTAWCQPQNFIDFDINLCLYIVFFHKC